MKLGRGHLAAHDLAIGAVAVGAFALGALAIGSLAIGALAIGRAAVGRIKVASLQINDLFDAKPPFFPGTDGIGGSYNAIGRFAALNLRTRF